MSGSARATRVPVATGGRVFAALGRFGYRRRWAVLAAWAALTLLGAVFGGAVFDRVGTVAQLRPDAESVVADARVEALVPEGPLMIAVVRGRSPYDPALVKSITASSAELRRIDGVLSVDDLYSSPGGQIGADNKSTVVRVELSRNLTEAQRDAVEDRASAVLRRIDAPQVVIGGKPIAERAFAEQAIRDATFGESIALGVLLIALVVILGGLVAASVPLLVALAAVAVTLLGLLGLTAVAQVSEYAVNVVTLLGIGLAVDYSLLLVARFREERAADQSAPLPELLARTTATAGRAVLISGLTVGAALGGLFAFAEPLLAAMALGGAVVVALATLIALTAVPALIAVMHRRIPEPGARTWVSAAIGRPGRLLPRRFRTAGAGRGPRTAGAAPPVGLLGRLAGFAQGRPAAVATVVVVGLLLLAAPFLHANLANSDARALPATMEARRAYDLLQRDFNADQAAPVTVVVEADPGRPEVLALLNKLNTLPQVARLQLRMDVPPGATVIDLTPRGETADARSRDLVRTVRAMNVPFRMAVAGPAAEVVDYRDSVASRLPAAVLVLLVATAVLLFALTGSVIVPLKALVMNALTLAATLGVLVVVFQWGWGAPLLGFESWGGLDLTTPVLLFVFVFGLSTDYEVFLLARIREEWDRRRSAGTRRGAEDPSAASDRAVLRGITLTGPVVTAAALCITIVFLGFVLGSLVAVKEIGVGMAVAVLIDVTVVRGLLLPAVMGLLGEWNWWAPGPLRRWYERWRPATTARPAPPRTRPVKELLSECGN
ncbi:MAG TPA: MMPL family transporter [Micromonosporaceae bacterium]|jgi:putative drug exporter of the RND superfamily